MRNLGVLVLVAYGAACGALDAPSEVDLARAELEAYGTQAIVIQNEAQIARTQVIQTVQVAEVQSTQIALYNQYLVATARANQNPTPSQRIAVVEGGAMSLEMLNVSDGQMRLMQVGVAGYIRPDDGCFETHQQYYTLGNTSVVYMTGLAINLPAGTSFAVDWLYEGQVVFRSSWTSTNFEVRRCIAIPMRSSDVAFRGGNWIARLFVNGSSFSASNFQMVN
jgi:hypothetical protein